MNTTDVLMTTTIYLAALAVLAVILGATSFGFAGVALFFAGVLFGWITSP